MKSIRLLYIGEHQDNYNVIGNQFKDLYSCFADNVNTAQKYLESRYPDIVIVEESVTRKWSSVEIDTILQKASVFKLIISYLTISNNSIITLTNSYNINKFINPNNSEWNRHIKQSINELVSENNVELDSLNLKRSLHELNYLFGQSLLSEA